MQSNHYKFFLNFFFFLSTKERKAKLRVAFKESYDQLLNLVTMQDKLEKIYPINQQQVAEIDELYDEIWKFNEKIKILEILLAKINVERSFADEEIELIEETKEKISRLKAELEYKQDMVMQEESETFKMFSDLYEE